MKMKEVRRGRNSRDCLLCINPCKVYKTDVNYVCYHQGFIRGDGVDLGYLPKAIPLKHFHNQNEISTVINNSNSSN